MVDLAAKPKKRRYRGLASKVKRRARHTKARIKKYRAKPTFPIAPIAGLAVSLTTPTGWSVVDHLQRGEFDRVGHRLSQSFLGYAPESKEFRWDELKYGLLPVFSGFAVHKIASILGINRQLGRAKIPYVRI